METEDAQKNAAAADVEKDPYVLGLEARVEELEARQVQIDRLRDELAEYKSMSFALLGAASDSVFIIDPAGAVAAVNDAGAMRLGKTAEELLDAAYFEAIPGETAAYRRRWIKEAIDSKKPVQFKDEHQGQTFGHRVFPFVNPRTNAVKAAVFTRDISESERAFRALRESEARYRAILEDQTELICRWLPDGRLSYVNEAYARYYGKDRQELINRNFIPHIPDEDLSMIREETARLSPQNPVTSFEHRIILDDLGEIRRQSWTHRAIYDASQNLVEYQAVGRDVTKRVQAQEALAASERRFRSLFEDSPISLWEEDFSAVKHRLDELSAQGVVDFRSYFRERPEEVAELAVRVRILNVNKATLELLGAKSLLDLERGLEGVFTPASLRVFAEELAVLAAGGLTFESENSHRTLSGEIKSTVTHLSVAPGFERTLGKVFVSVLDVSQRKRMEQELNQQRSFLLQVIDTVPSPIFVRDREGRFIMVNRAAAEMFGSTPSAMIGKPGEDFKKELDELSIMRTEDLEVLDSQVPLHIPQRAVTDAKGRTRWLTMTKLPLEGKDQVLGVAVDITERRESELERERLERHFRQAQKLQALGTLAGGIAHDFNNMIFAILGFVRLSLRASSPGSKLEGWLVQIQSAGMRASELVRQILTFSRQTEQEKKPVHTAALVREVVKMIRAALPADIEIAVDIRARESEDCEGAEDVVLGDPTQIHQVVMNLCTNGAHAMGAKGGRLEVALDAVGPGDAPDAGGAEKSPDGFVRLKVADQGHGIDPAIIEQIFDPFFTTKKPGEGTGMGLSVVHGIVQSHGGTIRVESEPGRGATFVIHLPRFVAKAQETGDVCRIIPGGRERIFFVDDEPVLVEMAKELLQNWGYTVEAFTDPERALARFTESPEDVALVVTDQTMPGLTGMELAKRLFAVKPGQPVILLTGWSEKVTPESAKAQGVAEFLMKPVVEDQLAQSIRTVIDRSRALRSANA